ncbi:Tgt2/MlaC family protein [Poseidonibacter antarcticus]|uniref:Tgt2/MlaC family protein n=1 Tax=Poseidonibacter antarcticus TaxID=2478538 RepID=UPI000EF44FAF|nr:ABC transporter substrate-binding protein [Poseidonibacter antarcticus]
MRLKNIFKILLLITFAITSANALKKDNLKEEMGNKINAILLVLKDKNIQKDQKGEKIVEIIDSVFDYNTMSKIALGKKTWKSISKEKREEFVKVFERKLKNSYIGKLELYTDQQVKIIELITYKRTRLQLVTELLGEDDTYEINYNFYKNRKTNEWFIYDVDLIGVSIIQTYRKQFSGLLKEKTFDEMLETLKEANEKN